MAAFNLIINDRPYNIEADPDMPLLWVIRDFANLTGTKFGCGIGQCGACTIHLNGEPVRSCMIPLSNVSDKKITTIEGISEENLHPVQQAWIEEQVPQCGYCQSGQILNAIALLDRHPEPTDEQIDTFMRGALCRCGTYPRIKKAIRKVKNL